MDVSECRRIINDLGAHKSLGQNFLVSRDIAAAEANYAKGMNVLELGPGMGILTEELCRSAKRVIAIEKDERLVDVLKGSIASKKLTLISGDFFLVDIGKFMPIDIMVSNIPYSLSSKVVYWLSSNDMPALLCVQKEFAQHMLAKPNTREYSKLSVASSLKFRIHKLKDVPSRNFYPVPKVDSCLIYLSPKPVRLGRDVLDTISLIMNHKKKRLRNAIMDSAESFGINKSEAKALASEFGDAESRPFQLGPERILDNANAINSAVDRIRRNRRAPAPPSL